MNTRKRTALLRKLGYEKSWLALTRVGITYRHPATGSSVTVPKGGKSGAHFQFLGGNMSFISASLTIGNLKHGASRVLLEVRDRGFPIPTTEDEDALEPGWYDALFVFLAEANSWDLE